MNRNFLTGQRLLALFLLAAVAFNYPILALFNRADTFVGVPILYIYLFCVWALAIGLAVWIIERRPR